MSDLPARWRRMPLGNVLALKYGKAHDKALRVRAGAYPVVGSAGEMARTDKPLALQPVVVIGRKGNVGQAHIHLRGVWPTDTTYFAYLPRDVDPQFLLYQLEALNLRQLDSSTATPSLRRQDLEAQTLVLPPLDEQRRIVAAVDAQLSRMAAAVNYLAAVNARSKTLPLSAFSSALASCSGAYLSLGDLARWGSGGTPRSRDPRYYQDGTVPWVVSGDLKDARLLQFPGRITERAVEDSAVKWVPAGAVLVAMYGATIGRTALTTLPLTTNQAVAHAVPRAGVSAEFLFWFLRSQRRALSAAGRGGAQPNISQTILKAWPVRLPAPEMQTELVRLAEDAEGAGDGIRDAVRKASTRGKALRRILLSAAVRGAL